MSLVLANEHQSGQIDELKHRIKEIWPTQNLEYNMKNTFNSYSVAKL